MVNQESIANSFANVKKDIMNINANLLEISGKQAELFELIMELKKSFVKSKKKSSSK